MRELTTLLHEIVQQTSFEVGQTLIAGGTTLITFDGKLDKLSPAQLRDTLERACWDSDERLKAESARPVSPDHLVTELIGKLRELLTNYITVETDRIRHLFPVFEPSVDYCSIKLENNGFKKYEYVSTISDLAKGLIRGATILGPDRAAKLLYDWIDEKPLMYLTSALLVGVTVEQELDLCNGVRVTPLPISSDALPVSLPRDTSTSVRDYLERVVLSVDTTVCPVFSQVQDSQPTDEGPHVLSDPGVASLDTLCEALSLICDSYVHSKLYWNDYEEVNAFSGKYQNNSWRPRPFFNDRQRIGWRIYHSTGVTMLTYRDVVPSLSLEDLKKAWKIHGVLDSRKRCDRRFRTAVSRWIRATRPDLEVTDQFIDLRIALEALYLDRNTGGHTFRLALTGAWHLGSDWSERKKIQRVLTQFYRAASNVVHGEAINKKKGDLKWLEQARDVCRRGILKIIEEEKQPDWNELLLGQGIE